MARFETRGQIISLFLGAALVSLAVIFLLNLEAKKRFGDDGQEITIVVEETTVTRPSGGSRILRTERTDLNGTSDASETISTVRYRISAIMNSLASLTKRLGFRFSEEEEEKEKEKEMVETEPTVELRPLPRRKRSISDDDFETSEENGDWLLYPYTIAEMHDFVDEETTTPKLDTLRLSENLLTEALEGHRIRNLNEKLAQLDPRRDQLVRGMTEFFCSREFARLGRDIRQLEKEKTILKADLGTTADVVSDLTSSLNHVQRKLDELQEDSNRRHARHETATERPTAASTTAAPPSSSPPTPTPHPAVTHHFPPVAISGAIRQGGYSSHDEAVGHDHYHHHRPIGEEVGVVCQSYGEVFLTIVLTTIANFAFFAAFTVVRGVCLNSCGGTARTNDGFVAFVNEDQEQPPEKSEAHSRQMGIY